METKLEKASAITKVVLELIAVCQRFSYYNDGGRTPSGETEKKDAEYVLEAYSNFKRIIEG